MSLLAGALRVKNWQTVPATARSKPGHTVADMANGPTRFGLPHPETVALLESLGSANSHNCRSDQRLVAPKEEKKPALSRAWL